MTTPITAKGAKRLRDELAELKSVKRPAVILAIAEARAHGDLKENAEYHAAREQQGFIEGRIKHLEAELSHAQVIDVSNLNAGDKVVFGATVVLADCDTDAETTYQIVGDLEAERSRHALRVLDQPAAALELLHRPPARHRLEVDGHVGDLDRLGDLADRGLGRLERIAGGGPDVDLERARLGHHVRSRPAEDAPDVDGDARPAAVEVVQLADDPRCLEDRERAPRERVERP